ncbi:MAG: helix-turn-helix transcriptional regulator [Clostridia bacterium]|nr:helix-turn-helix transcriptional regulator [Clostridia bacterium]
MPIITRKSIDWEKTGYNLEQLRLTNLPLRKKSCRSRTYAAGDCEGNCDQCRYDMDNLISRSELAKIFDVSEHVIYSWERGRTPVGVEELLLYCDIAEVSLSDILVFKP